MQKDDLSRQTRSTTHMVRNAVISAAVMTAVAALQGCISDPDCGVCDPDNLVLQTISGVNYAGKAINLLSPACEGENCPEPFAEGEVFVTDIGLCQESDAALESSRGVDEWCKISPMIVDDGVNFIFNNLLDPTSVELVRKQPTNPQLYEVYDWKTKILSIHGPISRYNGDYLAGPGDDPDFVQTSVNLSCIDNLAAQGIPFDHTSPFDACDFAGFSNGQLFPLRMETEGVIKTYGGETDTRSSANSCDTPDSGPDTCCSACDYDMGVNVTKYGVDEAGVPRTPNNNGPAAIQCDPQGDKFVDCAGFVPFVNREDEVRTYRYQWAGEELAEYKIPWQDRLRETHPNFRPNRADFPNAAGLVGFEQATVPCGTDADCGKVPGLTGSECVGHYEGSTTACSQDSMDTACVERVCRQPWFVRCAVNSDTLGNVGYCVDSRFSDKGALSCFQAPPGMLAYLPEEDGGGIVSVSGRLANADTDESGRLTAQEACPRDGSGVPIPCDPLFLDGTGRAARYDRNSTLPDETRGCICTSVGADDPCAQIIAENCTDENGNVRPEREGEYALKVVTRQGGVIYDPAIKGVQFRPADRGGMFRARVESCAEVRSSDTVDVDEFNIEDGWRANETFAEVFDNFDRSLCSSSEYTVEFATSDMPEHVRDKVGNTLDGKSTYKFETPDFHILPGSGFPTDNLRIGACDEFELRFSNKFDLSPHNLKKVEIVELVQVGEGEDATYEVALNDVGGEKVVAGGAACAEENEDVSVDQGRPPCLTVDVSNQRNGQIRVYVDYSVYDQVTLRSGTRYRFRVPGLNSLADAADPNLYKYAFWDACGMPLILGGHEGEPDYTYDFTVDEPKRKEDPDNDLIPLSCDNANDFYNPGQEDTDGDGIGDVYDLCLTIPSSSDDSADSDRDGVGNNCDTCTRTAKNYNNGFTGDYYMRVRNIPDQTDSDGDGIGDVCDNCSVRSNCADYTMMSPWKVGDPIDVLDVNTCQTDNDEFPNIGDACNEGGNLVQDEGAAGPVGFGQEDDFDQDGIANIRDYCPRQRPAIQATCAADSDCESGKCSTADGVCNHRDIDNDTVGDMCDTCPNDPNPMQILEGSDEEDDEDGDFVGKVCETNAECATRRDPKPYALYDVSANGQCCVVQFDEAVGRLDPDCNVLRADCTDTEMCRELPDVVKERPGIITLPDGCEDALAAAGYQPGEQASRIEIPDDATPEQLAEAWSYLCFLPQRDQDFDGIGDSCDKCKFAHDPNNEPFLDENGKLWPDLGKFCYGEYDPEMNSCGDDDEPDTDGGTDTEGDTDTDTDTGTTG